MKRLAILGASGHGKVIADTALASGWDEVVFFDDAWPSLKSNGPWPVLGNTAMLFEYQNSFSGVIVGIGDNKTRLEKTLYLKERAQRIVTLVHPRAYVSPGVSMGEGTVVFAGAIVQTGTSVGIACIINTSATVDHDCKLDFGVHVCPGVNIAGGVEIGTSSWIGIGSTVKQLVQIGCDVTVGAGAVVVSNVADKEIVVGVPARPKP